MANNLRNFIWGKGDRPRKVNKKEYDKNFTTIFGEKKLNVMSSKDREEMWKELLKIEEQENFLKTLDNASKIVSEWPEWKQNALGKLRKDI